ADAQKLDPTPAQATVEDTLALCAAGVGAVTLPLSVARLFHRRDLSVIPLSDGPEWPVALVWRVDSERIQDFVGITRGRGAHSSR
ncbi:MAG: LysR substrate-binding domain-containing protein, partial [Agromyces sp.]